jgi:hypothetical protein
MKKIISFFKSLFHKQSTTSNTVSANPSFFQDLQDRLIYAAIRSDLDRSDYSNLVNSRSPSDLYHFIIGNFVMLCQYHVITTSLIEEFYTFFRPHNIHANEITIDGYLLVDGDNMGSAYGATTAVAIHNGELQGLGASKCFGFNNAILNVSYHSYAEGHDNTKMNLYGKSAGKAFNHTKTHAWDKCTLDVYDDSETTVCGKLTNITSHSSNARLLEYDMTN